MDSDVRLTGKEELRRALRERRTQVPEEAQRTAAASLSGHVLSWLAATSAGESSGTVAAYLSGPPEPGTGELLPALRKAGYDVVVPVCEPQYQLSWVRWEPGVELAKSPRAPLLEPVGRRFRFTELGTIQLVVVPGLAMDAAGNRLGQGGGYYDRFLAQLHAEHPAAPAIGYLYDEEVLPKGSFGATVLDMPLPGAFTPSGYRSAL
ncbi:5-formyltetrahydrofolate cyclo-ligase [Arthrobacter pigmenti]|uniref:5-formyltetrahydrofolate cyclo-ligase n=1 Tax=Arthrobacter pigmenti TaxID=271432 RepID=A0A846RRK7_9MICC|nr:5-formyltetrahydrofolate cyclo-ligase [Arthrobacter pigmenti]NJC23074.1 5-formyltetrahydrofolate cyclo-ligase [Arthrobacter pigmenti]